MPTIPTDNPDLPDLADMTPPITAEAGQLDTVLAARFVDAHRDELRHCHPWKSWLHYDGTRWRRDDTGTVSLLAQRFARLLWDEAAGADTNGKRAAIRANSATGINAFVGLARGHVAVTVDELDPDPWLFNCANGTLNLRDGRLRPHDPADMITQLCPTPFDRAATCPTWTRCLNEWLVLPDFAPDLQLIEYLQRFFGMCLSGDVTAQMLPFLVGVGANGKTTLLETLQHTLGSDYAGPAAPGLLIAHTHESHPTVLADLFGKRFVFASESGQDARLNEERVKKLTGSETLKARRMREDPWSFTPTHKLVMCTNHLPRIQGTDDAIWRRLKLVEFRRQFTGADIDPDLLDTLRNEAPGILTWLWRGCGHWLNQGLPEPCAVSTATAAYRRDADPTATFVDERCDQHPRARVAFAQFYRELEHWCEQTGADLPSRRAVSASLQRLGFTACDVDSSRNRGYSGVRLRP